VTYLSFEKLTVISYQHRRATIVIASNADQQLHEIHAAALEPKIIGNPQGLACLVATDNYRSLNHAAEH
jgi:hypothetical protein